MAQASLPAVIVDGRNSRTVHGKLPRILLHLPHLRYPRILISDDLVATLGESEDRKKWVRRDLDGLHFLEVFSPELAGANGPTEPDLVGIASLKLRKARESLEGGLLEHAADAKQRMKWVWLAKHFNDVVTEFPCVGISPLQMDS